jgi:hypothetical protein
MVSPLIPVAFLYSARAILDIRLVPEKMMGQ